MKRVLLGLLAVVGLIVLVASFVLIPPHLQIRGVAPALPSQEDLRSLLGVAGGPTAIHLVVSSEQTSGDFELGHTSVVIEWPDGRLFVIDAAMDHEATLEFAELISLMGGEGGEVRFHGTIASLLGSAATRISGLGFTHLHVDHVQGIDALCTARGDGAKVVRTTWQAKEHNLHTEQSAGLVETSCFEPLTLAGEGLLRVDGFPGLGIAGLGGHTPGSTLFAVGVGEKLWLMSGDITNAKSAILENVGKGFVYSGLLVPEDAGRTELLRHWLAELDARPGFEVVVSHDVGSARLSGMREFVPPQP